MYQTLVSGLLQNGIKTMFVLRYGDCQFLRKANCAQKKLPVGGGQKRMVGRVSGNEIFFFFSP